MKFSRREQIETLNKFKSRDFLTTSFYLDTDKSRRTKKETVKEIQVLSMERYFVSFTSSLC